LLGVRIEEFFPLLPGQAVSLSSGDGSADGGPSYGGPSFGDGSVWSELGRTAGAELIASYADGSVAGSPAITRNAVGTGAAWYLGTQLGDDALDALLARVLAEAGVEPAFFDDGGPALPPGIEVVRRSGDGRSFTFVINHTAEAVELPLPGAELLTGIAVTQTLTVPAGAVRVVRS
jgi:beta-galactosidase